jgi:hypothetical protein
MDGQRRSELSGPGVMLLSAAIFGFFGFYWFVSSPGQPVLFTLFEWTVKGSAIAFGLAGLLTFARPLPGNVLFGAAGLVGAVLFVLVAVMDLLDRRYTVLHPVFILLFAAWNGYSSYMGLAAVAALRRAGEE